MIRGDRNSADSPVDGITAQSLNDHYATISTDQQYQAPALKSTTAELTDWISEIEVFQMLDRLKDTGLDGIPAWFLRLGAPVFAAPIAFQLVDYCRCGTKLVENRHHHASTQGEATGASS